MPTANPVLETYKGFEVRKSQVIGIRVTDLKYKEFIDIMETTGLTYSQIIAASCTPCSYCKDIKVLTINHKDEFVEVKRGVLAKKHFQHSGDSKSRNKFTNGTNPK